MGGASWQRPWIRFIDGSLTGHSAYGDGFDGDVEISTTVTLTRDMYYNNLTITGSGILNTASYRVFVKGNLIMHPLGAIRNDGNDAEDGTGVEGGAISPGTLGGGGYGGEGGYGPSAISAGSDGETISNGLGGSGGAGEAGLAEVGGLQGLIALSITEGGNVYQGSWPTVVKGSIVSFNDYWRGGTGGGGGGGGLITSPNRTGGGGGGGAGVIFLAAYKILALPNSIISAKGGDGGDANQAENSEGGGGGGGGGGAIIVYTAGKASSIQWTVDVSAGVGGVGYLGVVAASGANGTYTIFSGDI